MLTNLKRHLKTRVDGGHTVRVPDYMQTRDWHWHGTVLLWINQSQWILMAEM